MLTFVSLLSKGFAKDFAKVSAAARAAISSGVGTYLGLVLCPHPANAIQQTDAIIAL